MSIHITPIPTLIEFATPAITIGATSAAGDATTAIRSNSTIAGVGLVTSVDETIARFNGTAGQIQGYTSGGPTISDTGVMLKTAQPALLAYNASTQTNVTGSGTAYTVPFATEVFDQGANFSTPTFTAPVTGRYFVASSVRFSGITNSATRGLIYIVTSNRNYVIAPGNPGAQDASAEWEMTATAICDMDSSDTLTIVVYIFGESSDVSDVGGFSYPSTYLSVCLLV
jgi:hypothetical protein